MSWLREFSWRYFTLTGDIDAYLLFKQHDEVRETAADTAGDTETDEPEGLLQ